MPLVWLGFLLVQNKPLISSVCPNPTGKNGYEEFVLAVDSVTGELETALKSSPKFEEKGFLAGQRMIASKAGKCEEFVRKGVAKPVFHPLTEYWFGSTFPEVHRFFDVQKCLSAEAYVMFADGRPETGAQLLALQLDFASKVRDSGGFLQYFTGQKLQRKTLKFLQDITPLLTLNGADLVAEACHRSLSNCNLPKIMSFELQGQLRSRKQMVETPRDALLEIGVKKDEIDSQGIYSNWCGLTESKRSDAFNFGLQANKKKYDAIAAMLGGPEADWTLNPNYNPDPEQFVGLQVVPILSDFESDENGNFILAEAIGRTQLRLALLTCKIVQQKWKTGLIPRALEELKGDPTLDPLSNKSFEYQPRTKSFELYSQGGLGLEKITLSDFRWEKKSQ